MSNVEYTDHQWLLLLAGCPRCKASMTAIDDVVVCDGADCHRIWQWEELEDARS